MKDPRSYNTLKKTLKGLERQLMLSGMAQGKADALNNNPPQLSKLWGADTALLLGYVQSYDGWRKALENESKIAVKR
jgi:hypothetical protein